MSKSGDFDKALASLESKNSSDDKDILYYFEKGELLRQMSSYDASRDSWFAADARIRQWEDDARTDPSKLFGDLGSVLLNDTTRRYDGRDYEKVFLSVRLAMNHLSLGDWNAARTEIKKMHEREAVIADFRSKELDAAKDKAKEKHLQSTSFKQLDGYPIETLDDPAVRGLKNSYESAYANYLAGFVYEALGEPSLAAPGYRKAAEMRPNIPEIDDGLKNLDARMSAKTGTATVDTLFVVETGSAPTIQSVTLPIILPIPSGRRFDLIATPLSWPVIRPDPSMIAPSAITVDDKPLPVTLLTDVNVMARRALSDEMPGIVTRSAVRAITRGIAQAAIDKSNENAKGNAALVGGLISLITKVASVATEVADERIWRTLPGTYSVARVTLPAGSHKIVVPTAIGPQMRDIQVSGRYAVIDLRLMGNNFYVSQSHAVVTPVVAEVVQPDVKAESVQPAVEAKPVAKTKAVKAKRSKTKSAPKAAPAGGDVTAMGLPTL